jgi:hypothetical protein
MVLQTQPNSACDLHLAGVKDKAHFMRLYANAEGYIRVHMHVKEGTQDDLQLELDCASDGAAMTYPVRVRAGFSPTADMPAPLTSIQAPKDAQVLPALTDETARQFSDAYLASLGYPPRPDATASPDHYSQWLESVSRPMTLVSPHSVAHSGITHQSRSSVSAGGETSNNWSGLEARTKSGTYQYVGAQWYIPSLAGYETGKSTYSAFWVGLDGDGTKDLVQDGTEQDYLDLGGGSYATHYYAWHQLLPNQKFEQVITGLSVSPGDKIQAAVWIGDSTGVQDINGSFAWFHINDATTEQYVHFYVGLDKTVFDGSEAEWIMERPTVGGIVPDLANYSSALMSNAFVGTTTKIIDSGTAANVTITMYNGSDKLSTAINSPPNAIVFSWHHFH